jgi:hypothetical protein
MAGYSKTPLVVKLGLKAGMQAVFLRMPAEVRGVLDPLPEGVLVGKRLTGELDYVHFFAEDCADLREHFAALKAALAKDGMLWVSWRKNKNGTDLTENFVREMALQHGLVDVKVCAVNEVWSGLKLVYRLKDRS